jgi:hypothetical protein
VQRPVKRGIASCKQPDEIKRTIGDQKAAFDENPEDKAIRTLILSNK